MISWVSVMGMNKPLGRRLPDGLSEDVHFYRSQLEKKGGQVEGDRKGTALMSLFKK